MVLKKTDMNRLANAKSEEEARSMFDFVVVSYDMLKDMSEVLQAMDFNVVILDESHCIKNPTVSADHAYTHCHSSLVTGESTTACCCDLMSYAVRKPGLLLI